MSLDQAFIRAYTKSPAGRSYDQGPAVSPPAPPAPVSGEAAPLGTPDTWYSAGLRYRLDEPHPLDGPPGVGLPPHFPVQAYADLTYVNPYPAVMPATAAPQAAPGPHFPVAPAEEPVGTNAPAPVGSPERTLPAEPPPVAAPAADPAPLALQAAVPVGPDRAKPKAALQTAAELRLPAPLALPSIFRDPQAEAAEERVPKFCPDWEVDHFAWPEICTRLLAAEATYFQHVGEKLSEATAREHHVLMIAGSRRGEGRTTLTLCLALCAAHAGVPVALLDADLKNPQLGPRLGMEIPCGWSEVLRGAAPLHEAAVASVADQVTLFPLREELPAALEPGDPQLQALLLEIATHYPLVLVDVGPLGAEDRHPFAGDDGCPVNAAIVVRDLRNTTEHKALATARQLQHSGIPAVGIAENFVTADAANE